LHAVDRHWMPYRHAAGTDPALGLVPAGLACENQQSGRVHLEPNLQAVAAPLSGCVRHSPHLWIQYNSIGREGGSSALSIPTTVRTHTRRQKREAWLDSGRGNGATSGVRLLQRGLVDAKQVSRQPRRA
jgi:hypothetical protein